MHFRLYITCIIRTIQHASVALILLLVGCTAAPFRQQSALDRWSTAILQGNYDRAATLLTNDHAVVTAWQSDTEALTDQHQRLQEYVRRDLPPPQPGQPPIILTKWTWSDGYARCLRIQEVAGGQITLIDTEYRDCAEFPPALTPEPLETPPGVPTPSRQP